MPVSLLVKLEVEIYNVSISRNQVMLLQVFLMSMGSLRPQGQGRKCHIGRNLASERQKVERVPPALWRSKTFHMPHLTLLFPCGTTAGQECTLFCSLLPLCFTFLLASFLLLLNITSCSKSSKEAFFIQTVFLCFWCFFWGGALGDKMNFSAECGVLGGHLVRREQRRSESDGGK